VRCIETGVKQRGGQTIWIQQKRNEDLITTDNVSGGSILPPSFRGEGKGQENGKLQQGVRNNRSSFGSRILRTETTEGSQSVKEARVREVEPCGLSVSFNAVTGLWGPKKGGEMEKISGCFWGAPGQRGPKILRATGVD